MLPGSKKSESINTFPCKKALFFILVFQLFIINSVNAGLVHPGISHKKSDLERMKYMVEAGEEPWASEFAALAADSKSRCTYAVKGSLRITEISDFNNFNNDAFAAYYNALLWSITGEECHAEKAVEIFNLWVNVKRITDQFALNNGRGPWKMLEGAEIIKHTYDGWSQADQQKFKDMLVYPGWSGTSAPTAAMAGKNVSFYWNIYQGDPARHGNQGLFAFRSLMAMGIFFDSEIMYERALRYIRGQGHRADDLPYPSGPPRNTLLSDACDHYVEYRQNGRENTIEDYGYNEVMSNYIYENGQGQESSRDQAHAAVGDQILACMAEIAWNQGDDLYGHLDNRLLKGIEYFFRYNVGAGQFRAFGYPDWNPTIASGEYIERTDRTGRWRSLKINPGAGCTAETGSRGNHVLRPWYEMTLGHYRDRMNMPESDYQWLSAGQNIFRNKIGFENEGNTTEYHGWGGLKFHRVSPGDPIIGFSNGLPVFYMNVLPGTVEAENFDYFPVNGQGRTYNDLTPSNSGGIYRLSEGVDIAFSPEAGYNLTALQAGEWLTYTVAVPKAGTYDIYITYASSKAGGSVKFSFGGTDKTAEVAVPFGAPNSTGVTNWKTFPVAAGVELDAGVQSMKMEISGISDAFILNCIHVCNAGEFNSIKPDGPPGRRIKLHIHVGENGRGLVAVDGYYGKGTFKLFDPEGKLHTEGTLFNGQANFDIGGEPAGVYMLEAVTGSGRFKQKVPYLER